MARRSIAEIKQGRFFYRDNLHLSSMMLMISVVLNLLLLLAIAYQQINRGQADFYASNGVAITKLTALDRANSSSTPLLAGDPPEEVQRKNLDIEE